MACTPLPTSREDTARQGPAAESPHGAQPAQVGPRWDLLGPGEGGGAQVRRAGEGWLPTGKVGLLKACYLVRRGRVGRGGV